MSAKVAGVTGKYCAGKDAVCNILKKHGFTGIDEDRIGHSALEAKQGEVIRAFGGEVVSATGTIDRSLLGALVFADSAKLRRLEQILHPWMVAETRRLVAENTHRHIFINAAILFRMGLHELCDFIVIVRAPLVVRVLRGMSRDTQGIRHVMRRIRSQSDINNRAIKKSMLPVDRYTIRNGGSRRALAKRVSRVLTANGFSGR